MNEGQSSSLLVRILYAALFLVLTLGSFAWFFISAVGLISQFRIENPVVGFDKGSMYMLGCGLVLLSLTIGGMMQGIFGLELTPKKATLFSRGIVVGLILTFAFPHMTHYVVDIYAYKKHYSVCDDATRRRRLYSKFYYTESKAACEKLVSEKEIRKVSRGR